MATKLSIDIFLLFLHLVRVSSKKEPSLPNETSKANFDEHKIIFKSSGFIPVMTGEKLQHFFYRLCVNMASVYTNHGPKKILYREQAPTYKSVSLI